MSKDYQEVEKIVSDFCKEFQADRGFGEQPQFVGGAFDINDYIDWLRSTLTTYGNARELQGVEKCIKLSDEIELREPDGGTKQWMAFKAFRNAMRDHIAQVKSELK